MLGYVSCCHLLAAQRSKAPDQRVRAWEAIDERRGWHDKALVKVEEYVARA